MSALPSHEIELGIDDDRDIPACEEVFEKMQQQPFRLSMETLQIS